MKHWLRLALCGGALAAFLTCGASAQMPDYTTDADGTVTYNEETGKYTASYNQTIDGQQYAILVVKGTYENGVKDYSISEDTVRQIQAAKAAGRRVIAVGTTSCRTLEAVAAKYGEIKACSGNTSIFLYPGVPFRCIDGLITNFHLPESTLIMLVSAFYGYDKTMAAYKAAVDERYRFFSFGDAMLIL